MRRLLVPEVVQSSAMDCGPAALKGFLEGHGISLSYGRLREACQTDVDGTSIETLEELATGLGVPMEQVLLPREAVLVSLPAIAVFRLPNGNTHFVVVWSSSAGVVQVMDPGHGRRWLSRKGLQRELYEHVMTVPAADWRDWAASEEGLGLLRGRLLELRVPPDVSERLIGEALADESFRSLAALEASLRAADSSESVRSLFDAGRRDPAAIPESCWSVKQDDSDPNAVRIRGAVLLRPLTGAVASAGIALPPAIAAARDEKPIRPAREILARLRRDGLLAPTALAVAAAASAAAVVLEAILFRAFLADSSLAGALVVFLLGVSLLDVSIVTGELRIGRRLEIGLRSAFQRKIARLSDRYFASRLVADMAERLHGLHLLRKLPRLGRQILRESFELLLTAAAILWLAPSLAWIVAASVVAAVAIPLLGQPVLFERDARVRSHVGGLSRFYLDSLLGLVPLRVHRAESALRGEHEALLDSWRRARLGLARATVSIQSLQFGVGYGLVVLLVFAYLRGGGEASSLLLLAYWALNLPVLGLQLVRLLARYPEPRNTFVRVTEPLRARDEKDVAPRSEDVAAEARPLRPGMSIRIEKASVRVSGRRLLEGVDLAIEPGSHIAIVGRSGAGKTSLLGLLLGFHFPDEGRVLVDGALLSGDRLGEVRSRIAWVDPAVQLWNRDIEENLVYGSDNGSVESAIAGADLEAVVGTLPEGRATLLGEGGALVSGGEGQRVRFGRAFLRKGVRLVLLDEPFRGLERESRAELLRRARSHWKDATLLAITHDLTEAESFDRVLVLENGRLVEDGSPAELTRREDSCYGRLLGAERELARLWTDPSWRRWSLEGGALRDGA
jgi:ATP-binding cassette subfamily B protein